MAADDVATLDSDMLDIGAELTRGKRKSAFLTLLTVKLLRWCERVQVVNGDVRGFVSGAD